MPLHPPPTKVRPRTGLHVPMALVLAGERTGAGQLVLLSFAANPPFPTESGKAEIDKVGRATISFPTESGSVEVTPP